MKKKSVITREMPELLAPAGNFEKMVTAIHYGADAVYLGGRDFSLRAKAGNFDREQMAEAVHYAHQHGVRLYVTVNIFAHSRDFIHLEEYLLFLNKIGVDGIIVADPGILNVTRRTVPNLSVHLSTQANVTNPESALFWEGQGVGRLNLARELSYEEIAAVRQKVECELEIFVHGAICISYSGRCMLSNYLTGRDANQGMCSHPCRFSYRLMEEKRPGEYFPVVEDERGTYIFNSRDLCLLNKLPLLVAGGADSLKIEGRMKSIFYVGGVVRLYKAALNYLADLPEAAWLNPESISIPETLQDEVVRLGTRGATENFFSGAPGPAEMIYDASRAGQSWEPVAVIREEGDRPLVEMRNTVLVGEKVELMVPDGSNPPMTILAMYDEEANRVEKANPGNVLRLELDRNGDQGRKIDILRRKVR